MWLHSFTRAFVLFSFPASLALGGAPPADAQTAAAYPLRDNNVLKTCSDEHWLALAVVDAKGNPLKTCPPVRGWQASPLFDPRPDLRSLFCRYDWVSPSPSPPAVPGGGNINEAIALLTNRTRNPTLRATVRRCAVAGALATATSATQIPSTLTPAPASDGLGREMLYRELRFQVGATDLPLTPGQAPGVRLAVVDTHPTGVGAPQAPGQNYSSHGFDMAHIARDLTCRNDACDGGPHPVPLGVQSEVAARGASTAKETRLCAAEITTRLALPLAHPDDDPRPSDQGPGGYFGRPSDLAVAIVDEVDAWVAEAQKPPHLILNLSVGWDPELLHQVLHAEDIDHLNAEELAVYAALAYARAEGALPIAAAGNSHGGSRPGQGATLPARWYAGPPQTGLVDTSQDPVVWAVAAVDRNDQPLANVRAGSVPPLVVYGDHAVVPAPVVGWTDPLTGSSVSAIVASSIAAVAWHLQPDLLADQVMGLLERSGMVLPRQAELYRQDLVPGLAAAARQASSIAINVPPPAVRRLLFATALSRAWSPPRLYNDQGSFTATGTVSCSNAISVPCGNDTLLLCPGLDPATGQAWNPVPNCPPGPYTSIGTVPWVLPQPDQDPCPTCSISSGKPPGLIGGRMSPPASPTCQLYLEIPASWAGGSSGSNGCLTDLLVEVAVPGSSTPNRLWIVPPSGELCAGQSLCVTQLPFDPSRGTAAIGFRIGNQSYSVRSPLYVGLWP